MMHRPGQVGSRASCPALGSGCIASEFSKGEDIEILKEEFNAVLAESGSALHMPSEVELMHNHCSSRGLMAKTKK
jgi:hypothetical protein